MKTKTTLILGDTITLAVVTLIGFVSHGEIGWSFFNRFLVTLGSLLVAWFLVPPWLELFDLQVISNPKLLWRAPLAMLLAAPIAILVRALILETTIEPVFAIILGGSSALGLFIWRWLYMRQVHKAG